MTTDPGETSSKRPRAGRATVAFLVMAALLPSVAAWIYFVVLDGHSSARFAYGIGKVLQFSLPLVAIAVGAVAFRRPRRSWSETRGQTLWWTLWSVLAALATVLVYVLLLRGTDLAAETGARIIPKLRDFGATGPFGYLVLALGLSFAHSFAEEYYYRWYLLRGLLEILPRRLAYATGSLAFTAHHVIVIAAYAGPERWWLTVLCAAGVCASGLFWSWLYEHTGNLAAPWLSHIVADLLAMGIGWDLTQTLR